MTDIKLMPLPNPQVPYIACDPSMIDIRRLVDWYRCGLQDYARACVEADRRERAKAEEGTVVMRKSVLQYCIRELNMARHGHNSQALSKAVYRVLTNVLKNHD